MTDLTYARRVYAGRTNLKHRLPISCVREQVRCLGEALAEADRLATENNTLRAQLGLQRTRADRMESDAHELRGQLAAKSEWEASQHKLAARVVGEERAAIVTDLRKQAANTAKYPKPLGAALRGTLAGLAQRYENGEHHTTEP